MYIESNLLLLKSIEQKTQNKAYGTSFQL